jgi:lipoyl(octanoyl) transferase
MTPPLDIIDLGRKPYREVLELQRALRLGRLDGSVPNDLLLLVEHEPVYTLGRGTHQESLPLSIEQLRERGPDVVEIERGGDVTWHGPGQLVGYPILNLSHHREDLHWYLRTLEQALIDGLDAMQVKAERRPGKTGVWTAGRKIASIGVHVKQWVTLHGFALNVQPDLDWFTLIVPCGIHGVEMTSLRRELDSRESDTALWNRTQDAVIAAFGRAFARDPQPAYPSFHG